MIVIVNFNNSKHSNYKIKLPVAGTWRVRFNSTWQGYAEDFKEHTFDSVATDEHSDITVTLMPYCVYILSQD